MSEKTPLIESVTHSKDIEKGYSLEDCSPIVAEKLTPLLPIAQSNSTENNSEMDRSTYSYRFLAFMIDSDVTLAATCLTYTLSSVSDDPDIKNFSRLGFFLLNLEVQLVNACMTACPLVRTFFNNRWITVICLIALPIILFGPPPHRSRRQDLPLLAQVSRDRHSTASLERPDDQELPPGAHVPQQEDKTCDLSGLWAELGHTVALFGSGLADALAAEKEVSM